MSRAALEDLACAGRVLLQGVTGSGKSTAARRLSELLDLPLHLVDEEIGWLPGWVARSDEDQRALAAEIAAQPRWVFDTSYGSFRDIVLERADVIVALDYPRHVSLGRLLRRTAMRVVTQEPTCNGNTETWRDVVARDSIIWWHFKSFSRQRRRAQTWEADSAGPKALRFRRPRDLDAALGSLRVLVGQGRVSGEAGMSDKRHYENMTEEARSSGNTLRSPRHRAGAARPD